MILILICIIAGISALSILMRVTADGRKAKKVNKRIAALDKELLAGEGAATLSDIRKQQRRLSAIPLLNDWLGRLNLSTRATLFLHQAGSTTSLGTLVLTGIAGSAWITYMAWLRLEAFLPALMIGLGFLPMPFLYIQRKRARRLYKLEQQLPELLVLMASALRVGHTLIAGLGAVAQESPEPIGGEMRRCFEEQNYGIDVRTALVNLTQRVPVQDFRIFVAAVLIQKESGGNLAEVLEKVANTTRERFRLKRQVGVHTAQGRLTGWILSLLPVGLGVGMYFINPEGMSLLWTTSMGQKMLYGGSAMDVVGALLIRKIVRIRV